MQDTTEINFRGRDYDRRGLGKGGDGAGLGFFIHPVIAVDIAGQAVLGVLGAEIWSRRPGRTAVPADSGANGSWRTRNRSAG